MRMPTFDRRALVRFAELAVVLVLWHYITVWAAAAAAMLHLPLPEMPLIPHAYILFTLVILVCLWVYLRGEPLSDFGLKAPQSWWLAIGQGVLIFLASMVFDIAVRPLIDPWIAHVTGTSATLAEQHFAALKGNLGLLLYLIPFAWLFGGFGEEMLNRGVVMTRIAQLLGEGRWAWIAAMVLQAIPFALGHGYQGPVGMFSVFVGGVIYGAGALIWGRNLWPAIIAHGLQDTLGFVALYTGIAHG
ncbi:MAG TPA: type II CAAX endopeptidase family protein [Rhizomicrobium sp.]